MCYGNDLVYSLLFVRWHRGSQAQLLLGSFRFYFLVSVRFIQVNVVLFDLDCGKPLIINCILTAVGFGNANSAKPSSSQILKIGS